jgi:hypothetical protein
MAAAEIEAGVGDQYDPLWRERDAIEHDAERPGIRRTGNEGRRAAELDHRAASLRPRRQRQTHVGELGCRPSRAQRGAVYRNRERRILGGVHSRAARTDRERPRDAPIEPGQPQHRVRRRPGERQARRAIAFRRIDTTEVPGQIAIELDVDRRVPRVEQRRQYGAEQSAQQRRRRRASERPHFAAGIASA